MENNLINEKESKIIKPHELSINDSESSNIISLNLKPKTNRNNSSNKINLRNSNGILQINSPYSPARLNKPYP